MRPHEIGALTMIQPWADYIFYHGMNVENRQRNSKYRGTFAIHASGTKSKAWFDEAPIKADPATVVYGAIIGLCEVVDVITEEQVTAGTRKWFMGEYGFVLRNLMLLKKPVPAKGARGVWKLSGPVLDACLSQLNQKQLATLKPLMRVS